MKQRKKTTSKMELEDGRKETKVWRNEVKGGNRNEKIQKDGTAVRRTT
jgi:hypothetical protein